MSAFIIFSFNVSNPDLIQKYGVAAAPVLAKHGGRLLVADFAAKPLEGTPKQANVVVSFPTEEQAEAFYNDPEYAPLIKMRTEATNDSTVFLAKEWVRPA